MLTSTKIILGLVFILYLFNSPFIVSVRGFQPLNEDSYIIIGGNSIKAKNGQDVEYPVRRNDMLMDFSIQGTTTIEEIEPQGIPLIRTLTAYNAVESQTDSEPCIAASGMNVCETTKKIAASNEFPFGTRLLIDGEIWEVQDRTNARYSYRIDLLFESYEEAIKFGKQIKKVVLLN